MTEPLTTRQSEIYEYIRSEITARHRCPSVRDIGKRFDIKSPNGVACHLKALERKGYIRREPRLSRAIELLV